MKKHNGKISVLVKIVRFKEKLKQLSGSIKEMSKS